MPLVTTRGAAEGSGGLKHNKLHCMVCGKEANLLSVRPTDQKPACKECAGPYWGPIEEVKSAKKA